ncbi:MAG: hypothetical protein CVV64_15065 [Candidatus Wallbacteria bacterium HGW-Wallbacteria-1]|uniref:Uncharacterized protein n=1 Tax=Candidatus Wallbacteria bacterium HGW-Wallbacteria-1 TaxID=2013854 RepID=A0A2N1PLT2_9BACT|nr:MAG: hypothetical protein CVV64_15065 [Candidatus Wallbacteria bacterium HGW-Wallbacteria-1]
MGGSIAPETAFNALFTAGFDAGFDADSVAGFDADSVAGFAADFEFSVFSSALESEPEPEESLQKPLWEWYAEDAMKPAPLCSRELKALESARAARERNTTIVRTSMAGMSIFINSSKTCTRGKPGLASPLLNRIL